MSAQSLTRPSLNTFISRTDGHTWEKNMANSLWMKMRGPYAECFQTWASVLTRAHKRMHQQTSASRSNLSRLYSRICRSSWKAAIKVIARWPDLCKNLNVWLCYSSRNHIFNVLELQPFDVKSSVFRCREIKYSRILVLEIYFLGPVNLSLPLVFIC